MRGTKTRGMIFILVTLIFFPEIIFAERVKPLNPDCDVCPVVICYEGEEARRILGGLNSVVKLSALEEKTSKIDLDGVRKTGSEKDADEGYELLVFSYKHLISINSIHDGAVIQIKTDHQNLSPKGSLDTWAPEIHLRPPDFARINKTDSLDAAWNKFKEGSLYSYVNRNNTDHGVFTDNLRKMILYVLDSVTE